MVTATETGKQALPGTMIKCPHCGGSVLLEDSDLVCILCGRIDLRWIVPKPHRVRVQDVEVDLWNAEALGDA